MTTQITEIAIGNIRRSPNNPRRTFLKIEELAESIKLKGLINPVTVRPSSGPNPGTTIYELVAGERRWRAAKLAKLATIPAIVRELTDKDVLEIQVIENVQREDVHQLEEADGYEELISKHGYDVEQIAAKIGKSKAYVYARLKLASLCEYARDAFLADRLSASIALLIARIPSVELQERATKDVLGETTYDEISTLEGPLGEGLRADLEDPHSPLADDRRAINVPETIGDAEPGAPWMETGERVPMSVREAQIHLRRRYMLRLELATFDVADPQLCPTAGACTTCDYRTGKQPELFADVAAADVCTNPPCFERKTAAAWELKKAGAEGKGVKVIEAGDAAKVFTPSAQVRATSPYVDPDDAVPMDLLPAGTKKAPTWSKLLGKKVGTDDAPYVLVQDLTGAGHELIDKRTAVETLRELGKIDKPLKPAKASSSSSPSKDPYKEQAEKEAKKRGQWGRAAKACLEEAWEIAGDLDLKDPAWWEWIANALLANNRVSRFFGAEAEDPRDLLAKAEKLEAFARIITAALLDDNAPISAGGNLEAWRDPSKDKEFLAGLELLGVDYDKHLERIKASDKEAAKAEAKLAKQKGGKK